jgi:hypothetical protein
MKAAPPPKIALALTWDGARWPRRSLPAAARAFLGETAPPSSEKSAQLFTGDRVKEIRVCWVPRLSGGKETLSAPFFTPNGKRLAFRMTKSVRWGNVLGVVYRRD